MRIAPLLLALVIAAPSAVFIVAPQARADGTETGPKTKTPPKKTRLKKAKRNRALERKLKSALVTASVAKDADKRAAADKALAEADRLTRYYVFAGAVNHGRNAVRRRAWKELLAMRERAAVPLLCRRLVIEPERELRIELTRTIRAFEATGVGNLFIPYLREKKAVRRFRALQAMGVFPTKSLVRRLIKHQQLTLSGFGEASVRVVTQRAYIRSWKLISGGTGLTVIAVPDPEVDFLETGVSMSVKVARIELNLTTEVLQEITGAPIGADPGAWATYYAEHPEYHPAKD